MTSNSVMLLRQSPSIARLFSQGVSIDALSSQFGFTNEEIEEVVRMVVKGNLRLLDRRNV